MSVLQELEKRLVETEEQVTALVRNLEDHADLEESLRTAGSSLLEASTEVRRLAKSALEANKSLGTIITSFQEAIEILRNSDPLRTAKSVERIEQQLSTESKAIRKAMPKRVGFTTLALVMLLIALEVLRFLQGSVL